ncbi:MAG: type I-MYXAN CRISPR-associated protein Cas6/Cmx6 [Pseudomonadota bacterium]
MYWSDETRIEEKNVSAKILDLSIHISCKKLPSDHIYHLATALVEILPWLQDDPRIAIQQIYLPASGNGWQRAEKNINDLVYLSKRTRLKIRLPMDYIQQLQHLIGKEISVAGFLIQFGSIKEVKINASEILISRFVYFPETENDEEKFLTLAYQQLKQKNIVVKKMLCGKTTHLNFNGKEFLTRSLMLADLTNDDSLALQEQGIGNYYLYGCGVFIPQKGIKALNIDK